MTHAAAPEDLERELARLGAALAQAEFERDLARDVQRRLGEERDRLDRRIALLDGERARLRAQLDERDALLQLIFHSRSWRLLQALRRLAGRA